jgi:hypothetical protein
MKASNSCARILIFGSFFLLSFVKFFPYPFFIFFDLAFYCLFSFFLFGFLLPFVFPLFFALVLYLFFYLAHVVSSLAYPNLLGNKMLGCCCCWLLLLLNWKQLLLALDSTTANKLKTSTRARLTIFYGEMEKQS